MKDNSQSKLSAVNLEENAYLSRSSGSEKNKVLPVVDDEKLPTNADGGETKNGTK